MEQERIDDLYEMRVRHLERMTGAVAETQQDMAKILTDHAKQLARVGERLDRIETRMDALETRMDSIELRGHGRHRAANGPIGVVYGQTQKLLTLMLDDLAFIKNALQPGA